MKYQNIADLPLKCIFKIYPSGKLPPGKFNRKQVTVLAINVSLPLFWNMQPQLISNI